MFTQLKAFADIIVLRPSKNGILLQCMDSSKICLLDSLLSNTWFDEYSCEDGGNIAELGLAPRVMGMVLSTWKEGQSIEVSTQGPDAINVTLESSGDAHLNKYFRVQLIEVESELLDLSEKGESQVDLTLPTKRMVELVTQLSMFDSVLRVDFGDETVVLESMGNDGALRVEVALEDVTEYALTEPLQQQFSLSYLQTICGFGKLCSELAMKFSPDRPMEAQYVLGDDSHVTLYLAPKIDSD